MKIVVSIGDEIMNWIDEFNDLNEIYHKSCCYVEVGIALMRDCVGRSFREAYW